MNWGNCLRCCCLMLPISWTISSFVLIVFILVGNTSNAPFPADTYFLRMNVSAIDPNITPTPGYTIAETLGLHDFYQTGLWNFCEGYYRTDLNWRAYVTTCGPEVSGYYFDPISIMATELLPPYEIVFVQSEVDAIQKIHNTAAWLRAAFVITGIFTGFTLFIGPLTGVWHQRRLFNCIPVCSMCVAAFFWFLGAVTATNVYFKLRDAFNNDVRLHVQADMGHQMFAWVWLGVWTSSTAASQWCCAAICCPGGHRKRRIAMRRPFENFIPIPWLGSHVETHVEQSSSMTAAMISNQDGIPVSAVFPQPPLPPPDDHHHGGAIATGLAVTAIGAAALAEHVHHQHQQNNPPPPPPPPPQEHHNTLATVATGAALLGGAAYAYHQHEQHHHQPPPQENPPPPPPQQQHHGIGTGIATAVITAGGVALADHLINQQNPPPQPPPQNNNVGGLLTTGATVTEAVSVTEQVQIQQTGPPLANFQPPPAGGGQTIPILPPPNLPVGPPLAPLPLIQGPPGGPPVGMPVTGGETIVQQSTSQTSFSVTTEATGPNIVPPQPLVPQPVLTVGPGVPLLPQPEIPPPPPQILVPSPIPGPGPFQPVMTGRDANVPPPGIQGVGSPAQPGPPISMPAAPQAAVAATSGGQGALYENFPFGRSNNVVAGSVDELYNRSER